MILRKTKFISILFLVIVFIMNGLTTSHVHANEMTAPHFDTNKAIEHIRYLSEGIGPRVGGTEEEKLASNYAKNEFEKMGYDVTVQEFGFANRREDRLVINGGKEIPLRSAVMSELTDKEGVSAQLIDLGFGDQEVYPEEVQGKIIFIQRGKTSFRTAAAKAKDAGALGLIVANDDEGALRAFRPGTSNEQVDIPLVGVTKHDGEMIKEMLMNDAGAKADLLVFDHKNQTSQNVIAVKKATNVDNPKIVYVTSHIDSVPFAPGANDNASGTGLIIEIARGLQDYNTDVEIRFIAFGHEESGAVASRQGSKYYVNNLTDDELNRSIANFNFDMVATSWEPASSLNLNIVDGRENILYEYAMNAADKIDMNKSIINVFERGSSDHQSFFDVGIDSANFSWRVPGTADLEPYYHSPEDTMEHISKERMEIMGTLISTSLFEAFYVADPVDTSELEKMIENIKNEELDEESFTKVSWDNFQQALTDATETVKNPEVSQEEIDKALNNLKEAFEKLEVVADKSILIEKMNKIVNENLKEANYTKESWKSFQNALIDAEETINVVNATQEEVNLALENLINAYEALERNQDEINRDELERLIESILDKHLQEKLYTKESWKLLEESLKNANNTMNDLDATLKEIDHAFATLLQAFENLKEVKEEERLEEEEKLEQEEAQEKEKQSMEEDNEKGPIGKLLPKTATPMFNFLVIGSIILVVGGIALFFNMRKMNS